MGDPDDGHAQLVAQLTHQLQNLRLNGDIECRRGLIGNQHLGVASQRNSNHDALAHAARKLVRKVV